MRNESKIKGDNNSVIQGVKNSRINETNASKSSNSYVIIGIILAILTLVATIVIGWENIEKFFTK